MSSYKWCFNELGPNSTEEGDAVRGNFIRESTSPSAIFVRELLQNTLDARIEDDNNKKYPARVTINFIHPDKDFNKKICEDIIPYIKSIDKDTIIDLDSPEALVIEEYGTTGLIGKTDEPHVEGEKECWANFWHKSVMPTKTKSLGRAGQGKVTLFMASQLNCLLAITRRYNEDKDYAYGKCVFSNCPQVNGKYYERNHIWGIYSDPKQPVEPVTEINDIQDLQTAYQLKRKVESGISFIIPYPNKKLTEDELIKAVIKDFYFIIFTKQLSVSIGNIDITSSTLADLVIKYLDNDSKPSAKFLSFMEKTINDFPDDIIEISAEWQKSNNILPEYFPDNKFDSLKEFFNNGDCIAVRFPITIYPKNNTISIGSIDVFLQYYNDITLTEDLFIRDGLLIGEERPLQKNAKKCFALVKISDPDVSDFLGYSEEPSHNKWKKTEPEVVKRYNNVPNVINLIRDAALILYNAMRGYDVGRYDDVFDDILSIPYPDGKPKRKKKKTIKPGGEDLPEPPPDIRHKHEPFWEFYDLNDNTGIGMKSIKNKVPQEKIPLKGILKFAYNLLEGDGDPFINWHPFDFDLSEKKLFKIQAKGITILSREDNEIKFSITDVDFALEVSGFNAAQQIKVKGIIEYEE